MQVNEMHHDLLPSQDMMVFVEATVVFSITVVGLCSTLNAKSLFFSPLVFWFVFYLFKYIFLVCLCSFLFSPQDVDVANGL